MKKNKLTTAEMEFAVALHWGTRQNLIVPNVSWGLLNHECDLIIMSGSGYLTEIEIKISLSDLKRDKEKRHDHRDNRIKYLYFALPSYLCKHIEYVPARAGIIAVTSGLKTQIISKPEINSNCRPLTDTEKFQLARLGALLIWRLKQTILNQKHYINLLKQEKNGEK